MNSVPAITTYAVPDDDGYRPSQPRRERIAHRRRQTVRSVIVAAASTAVVGIVLSVVVTGSAGWE